MTTRRRVRRRAVAAVELAILAPFFVILLFGLWEVGRVVHLQQVVNNAAREGGRQASTGEYTKAEVEEAVRDYLIHAGFPVTDPQGNPNVTVIVSNLDSGGEVKDADQGEHLRVEVSYPYANIQWLASGKFVDNSALLNASSDWFAMTDVPITVSTTVPSRPLP